MKDLVTPQQVAQAINVSVSSVKRWCDEGKILCLRTGGGHRRLQINSVLDFLRKQGMQLVSPEILGLPAMSRSQRDLPHECARFQTALLDGEESTCVEILLGSYLARSPVSSICDQLISRAFTNIGDSWDCGEVSVYQERRACELCSRSLYELRRALPELPVTAPIAVGGTVDGDPYTLASSMAEVVLRDIGWRASTLGNMLPFRTLSQALCDTRPRLFWLSVSHVREPEKFLEEFAKLSELAEQNEVALVVGGRRLDVEMRQQMKYHSFCDTFEQLATLGAHLLKIHDPTKSA